LFPQQKENVAPEKLNLGRSLKVLAELKVGFKRLYPHFSIRKVSQWIFWQGKKVESKRQGIIELK
jgi:hypothetical protein